MCGILCCICKYDNSSDKLDKVDKLLQNVTPFLENRGPDYTGKITCCDESLLFYSSVLWQQGPNLCQQPLENKYGILIFNGDIFMKRDSFDSDTEWLQTKLANLKSQFEFLDFFKILKGPFSLIYLDKISKTLYFFRDSLGRNSLLIAKTNEIILLGSVFGKSILNSIELPPLGVYCIDLNQNELNMSVYPWQCWKASSGKLLDEINELLCLHIEIRNEIHSSWLKAIDNCIPFSFHDYLSNKSIPEIVNLCDYLLNQPDVNKLCVQIIEILNESLKERIQNTPTYCKACIQVQNSNCNHSKVGILFSGGVDCTILALLADKFVDINCPIDLLNVAFEKIVRPQQSQKKIKQPVKEITIDWNVPDRISAKNTLEELQKLSPARNWNLVEINITRDELQKELQSRISDLVYPLKSILDESIGAALWFASRGNGELYQSNCRVLLLGSGADELFGGYSRHRVAFLKNYDNNLEDSYSNLQAELELDWERLPSRNLARDDRVIADNGITPRTPYIQEDLIALVRNLRANQKCYHLLEQGIGDKLILRLCAYLLGLRGSAILKKRALQFGSRIADRKQNAKDISSFLSSE